MNVAATLVEKAFRVLECARTQSTVFVQRSFRTKFGKDPPGRNSIKQDDLALRRRDSGAFDGDLSTQPPKTTNRSSR